MKYTLPNVSLNRRHVRSQHIEDIYRQVCLAYPGPNHRTRSMEQRRHIYTHSHHVVRLRPFALSFAFNEVNTFYPVFLGKVNLKNSAKPKPIVD